MSGWTDFLLSAGANALGSGVVALLLVLWIQRWLNERDTGRYVARERRIEIRYLVRKLIVSQKSGPSVKAFEDFERLFFLISLDDELRGRPGNQDFLDGWEKVAPAFPQHDGANGLWEQVNMLDNLLKHVTWE